MSWSDHALDVLTRQGFRRGGARRAVVELLGRQHCALTPYEIDDALRAAGEPVGRASIYRVLEVLHELGLVQRVTAGQGPVRYEPVDPTGEHHHHLVCGSCGTVTPFADPELERAIARLSDRVRFAVDDHEVVLHGSCRRCAA